MSRIPRASGASGGDPGKGEQLRIDPIHGAALVLAGVAAATTVGLFLTGRAGAAGPALILLFAALLVGIRGVRVLRGFAFTTWVVAGATAALYYPEHITEVMGFETERWIVPLIQLIMFGMGTAMSLHDFAGVLRMPRGVLVGLSFQFTVMPLLGVTLAFSLGFPPEIAAGIVLVGCAPSGVASNIMAFIARGNLALSVTLTTVATLAAPLVTPALMRLFADQFVPIDVLGMMRSILYMIVLPVVAGLLFNHLYRNRPAWLGAAMPVLAMAANVIIIAVIVAAGRDALLAVGLLLLLAAVVHNAAGYFLGYWGARLAGMDRRDCRTIAFEVGMQNGGMAAGLAAEMGRAATMGLFPALFGTWMDVSGSALANWWRGTERREAAARGRAEAVRLAEADAPTAAGENTVTAAAPAQGTRP
jgi:bile acid:Na+ symporter, BASS family